MEASSLRCALDKHLSETLKKDSVVRSVVDQLARMEEKGTKGVRRQLLATSLRLTPAMSPSLAKMTDECVERLGVEIPLETYVYPSPQFNAACVKPEDGRLFIMLSSSLLEAFTGSELRFVMGHELGHYLFGHHDIPIGYIVRGQQPPPPELALNLFAWSRYAEISADRAGAVCAGDGDAVARSLFRLASGLRSDTIKLNIEDFASQIDDLQEGDDDTGKGANEGDWFSTHPFSPLRLKALALFDKSKMATGSGMDNEELEAGVSTLMALMEPSYLEEKSAMAETMRRALFAGAIAVADSHGGISEEEVAAFEKFFGAHAFRDDLDVGAIKSSVPSRMESLKESVPHARCVQVVRDLCVIARADNDAASEERVELIKIAKLAGVSAVIVDQALREPKDLD